MRAIVADDRDERLPIDARASVIVLAAQLEALQTLIGSIEKRIKMQHRSNETSQRVETVPGIGVLGATAIGARLPHASKPLASDSIAGRGVQRLNWLICLMFLCRPYGYGAASTGSFRTRWLWVPPVSGRPSLSRTGRSKTAEAALWNDEGPAGFHQLEDRHADGIEREQNRQNASICATIAKLVRGPLDRLAGACR
jgi:hypothetical protein